MGGGGGDHPWNGYLSRLIESLPLLLCPNRSKRIIILILLCHIFLYQIHIFTKCGTYLTCVNLHNLRRRSRTCGVRESGTSLGNQNCLQRFPPSRIDRVESKCHKSTISSVKLSSIKWKEWLSLVSRASSTSFSVTLFLVGIINFCGGVVAAETAT